MRPVAQPKAGFDEGLVGVRETFSVDDLAVCHDVELRVSLIHIEPRVAATPLSEEHDHPVLASIDHAFQIDLPGLPHLSPAGRCGPSPPRSRARPSHPAG